MVIRKRSLSGETNAYYPNFVDLKKVLIFAFSILHEQTIAKARSKLVG